MIRWPEGNANETVLVEEAELPLRDDSADCIVLVHVLEGSGNAGELLRELWRVLAPNGRLLIVVPEPPRALGATRHHAVRPRSAL